jgi:hypothetical protein
MDDQPFAGRQDAFLRLHQNLTAPPVFVGRRKIGKTALLREIASRPSDALVGVYVASGLLQDAHWLHRLYQTILGTLAQHNLQPSLAEAPPEDHTALQAWFTSVCLPSVFRVLHQRRLVLLIDDMNSADHLDYLHSIAGPQFSLVFSLDLQHEDLLTTQTAFRLSRLTYEQIAMLFPEETIDRVYRQTGGEPVLVQRFLEHGDDHQTIYTQSVDDFKLWWDLLSSNEQLVASAIGRMRYDDPLRPIDADVLEAWLVQSEHPMDATTINAALRGLEYQDLVVRHDGHVDLAAGLFQTWLLDHVRRESPARPAQRSAWLIVLLLALIALLAFIAISQSESDTAEPPPLPTLTLES